MTDHAHDPAASAAPADDLAAAFQIEGWPVRGRIVRLGETIDAILSAHAYPEPVAALLGEACALAALVGSSLKFEGRLIVQAQGDGPVRYVVADYDTDGHMRGYCRFDEDEVAAASQGFARPGARSLLGQGVFVMTLDRGPDFERTQGITPIEGESLSLAAEHYFQQSEQIPTRVRLAVGSVVTETGTTWRAGGALIQLIAGDDARGSTEEVWDRSRALFQTLADDELLDPTVTPETLLFRLFHEDGVRLEDARALVAQCRCSRERIASVLTSFDGVERAEMVEADGLIRVTCEYCATIYELAPDEIAPD
ncbi:MAG: Hsp33 family molecular chaperone [Alphaproteobacteria bacterium]|uniref:Hsp33 family molecular chaperone n=1 Tax=Brevundimonas sp. TaxID=1871086 RepID=UPI0018494405|nr:Hsp33 family molecular chaperone [Brevundimonas sp.]MBU3971879.1 Hsp33 family molecular chaperone [Alphaproteobacteria bacterium]MBA3049222.1 Hsp33 family molecular chaperone [Brevundimonas sp.]MBU3975083.1 Hsp33 family molecular chaperone [Alphaproteobacteria bacterium]MBU4038475.1 Hsp33 family molecular chaperone [Alphaproteobacteria bacterium]MBU4136571.1 Hsp33 family molecular chaperone [Alphaproteobacteria bacterium]